MHVNYIPHTANNSFGPAMLVRMYKKMCRKWSKDHSDPSDALPALNTAGLHVPDPEFYCPLLYGWLDCPGNERQADKLCKHLGGARGTMRAFIRECVWKSVKVCTLEKLRRYPRVFLDSVLVPLIGENYPEDKHFDLFAIQKAALTLCESGVKDPVSLISRFCTLSDLKRQRVEEATRCILSVEHVWVINLQTFSAQKVCPFPSPTEKRAPCQHQPCHSMEQRAGGRGTLPHKEGGAAERRGAGIRRQQIKSACSGRTPKRQKGHQGLVKQYESDLNFLDKSLKNCRRIDGGMGLRTVVYQRKDRIGRYEPSYLSFVRSSSRLRRFSCTQHSISTSKTATQPCCASSCGAAANKYPRWSVTCRTKKKS